MTSHLCMFNHELLVSYASGNVSNVERTTVERHLAQCANCRKEIQLLEEIWWSLDVWEDQSETFQPRVNDFRCRFDQQFAPVSPWTRWSQSIQQYLDMVQLKPIMAFGTLLFASLMVIPMMKQNDMMQSPPQSTAVSSRTETFGHVGQHNASVISATSWLEQQKERDFERALFNDLAANRSMNTNVVTVSKRDLGSFNMGYSPNAGVMPAHQNQPQAQPSTVYQTSLNTN